MSRSECLAGMSKGCKSYIGNNGYSICMSQAAQSCRWEMKKTIIRIIFSILIIILLFWFFIMYTDNYHKSTKEHVEFERSLLEYHKCPGIITDKPCIP